MPDLHAHASPPNPYAAPRASVTHVADETRPARLFSAKGRIGRLRYLFWSSVFNIAISAIGYALIVILAVIGITTGMIGHHRPGSMAPLFAGIVAIVVVAMTLARCWVSALLTIQRSHDMDWTGWTSLICLFVPFAVFVWIFKPGARDANLYGAPPPPTPPGMKICAIGLPILCAIAVTGFVIHAIMRIAPLVSHMH